MSINEFQQTCITEENPGTFEKFAMLKLRLREGLSFAECERFGNAVIARLLLF